MHRILAQQNLISHKSQLLLRIYSENLQIIINQVNLQGISQSLTCRHICTFVEQCVVIILINFQYGFQIFESFFILLHFNYKSKNLVNFKFSETHIEKKTKVSESESYYTKEGVQFLVIQKNIKSCPRIIMFQLHIESNRAAKLGLTTSQISYLIKNHEFNQLQELYFNLNKQHISWIKQYLRTTEFQNLITATNVYKDFLSQFNLGNKALSLSSFNKILKKYCKVSYRFISKKNLNSLKSASLERKYEYAIQLLSLSIENHKFIYLDETALGHNNRKLRCWQVKQESKYQMVSQLKDNICILGAIGNDHFIVYQVVKGYVNKDIYSYHLHCLLREIKNHYGEQKFTIILDNSPIHKSKKIQQLLSAVSHIFLPLYTPQLNPIELLWNSFKNFIYNKQIEQSSNLHKKIHNFFNQIQAEDLNRYLFASIPYLKQSLLKIDY